MILDLSDPLFGGPTRWLRSNRHKHLQFPCLCPFLGTGCLWTQGSISSRSAVVRSLCWPAPRRRIASAATCCFARELSTVVCATAVAAVSWLIENCPPSVRPTWSSLLVAIATMCLSLEVISIVKSSVSPLRVRLAHALRTVSSWMNTQVRMSVPQSAFFCKLGDHRKIGHGFPDRQEFARHHRQKSTVGILASIAPSNGQTAEQQPPLAVPGPERHRVFDTARLPNQLHPETRKIHVLRHSDVKSTKK